MQNMQEIIIAILGAIAAGLASWGILRSHAKFVESGAGYGRSGRLPLFFRLAMPYANAFAAILSRYHKFVPPKNLRQNQSGTHRTVKGRGLLRSALDWLYLRSYRRLLVAGNPVGLNAERYLGLWIFGTVLGGAMGIFTALTTGWVVLMPVFLLLGFLLPSMWLSDMVVTRQIRIKKELPFALDLLTLSVESGMDFTAAMAEIVDKLKGSPLAHEFDLVYKQINIGQQRADALREMSDRTDMAEINTVVSSLIQADELGTGLGMVLRIQAEEVRRRRFETAEKKAQQAPVKMLFPLVIFVFPATMITILSPIIVRFLPKLLSSG